MKWQRARTPDKIEERRAAILIAAKDLFSKHPYEEISFNAIAAKAKFTKSNVYRYFASREEIFLIIYSELCTKWSKSALKSLSKLKPGVTPDEYVEVFVKSLRRHEDYLNLSPFIFLSLQKNSSTEQLEAYSQESLSVLYEQVNLLRSLFQELKVEDAKSLIRLSHSLMCSLWPASKSADPINNNLGKTEFASLAANFEGDLKRTLTLMLKGLLAETKRL